VFSTGNGRKTDATDAHSIAVVAIRTAGLQPWTDPRSFSIVSTVVPGGGVNGICTSHSISSSPSRSV
jgi:hypothetical protein